MAAIPTLAEEDARRPNRERDCLVRERTRIINRMKSALVRLGIRGFNPKLRKAADRLDDLVSPLGEALPPNTRAELRRDLARLALQREQIKTSRDLPSRAIQRPATPSHACLAHSRCSRL